MQFLRWADLLQSIRVKQDQHPIAAACGPEDRLKIGTTSSRSGLSKRLFPLLHNFRKSPDVAAGLRLNLADDCCQRVLIGTARFHVVADDGELLLGKR